MHIITYLPMTRGFVHLAAVVAWQSRRVRLSEGFSTTGYAPFCQQAVKETTQRPWQEYA